MLPKPAGHLREAVKAEVVMHCWPSALVRQKRQSRPSKFFRDLDRQAHRDLVIVIQHTHSGHRRTEEASWKTIVRQFVDLWMGRSEMNTVGLEVCVAIDPEARERVESPVSTHVGTLSPSQRSPPDFLAGG